jgi:phosphogluconate dehydratase
MPVHARLAAITERIRRRSAPGRHDYLGRIEAARGKGPARQHLSCANLAHGAAGALPDQSRLKAGSTPNIGIVTAYNDMLSAHRPYETYPALIRDAARSFGGTAQVAGGVPAMCDGVTQGEPGMELSLFSRDTIALSTAIALSHQMFDAALCLGICDKIVPGLVAGALAFGHLPVIFVPGGPMPSGLSNDEKTHVRQLYAEGKVGREALLESESRSYHSPGTCTFYGTANSNQMLMEVMGLHVPGAAFINPYTGLRDALTRAATRRALEITALGAEYTPIGHVLDERAWVNGIVALLATGGSTNLTIHMVTMAQVGGITLTWDDFTDLAEIVPLLARVYPNGKADVNQFRDAGGTGYIIRELLAAGLLHDDVTTVWGRGLAAYAREVSLAADGSLVWAEVAEASCDPEIVRPVAAPFQADGGLRLVQGNLGRGIVKVSAIAPERLRIEAPAAVFESQEAFQSAFRAGDLNRDLVAVVRFQGPKANGMPELHNLMPPLQVLQNRGFRVALVTDGRLSGASGRVPAALHVSPEALDGGALARVCDGDIITLDATAGRLEIDVPEDVLAARVPHQPDLSANRAGVGRELFAGFRASVGPAEQGATILFGAVA